MQIFQNVNAMIASILHSKNAKYAEKRLVVRQNKDFVLIYVKA